MIFKKGYILLTFKFMKVSGLALYPLIITKNKNRSKRLINHELIHHRQQLELFIVPFYIWYIIEYLLRLIRYQNREQAYLNISFEREAYIHDHDLEYLKNRKFWSFLKYI